MLNKKFIGSLVVMFCLLCMVVAVDATVVGEWNMNEGTGAMAADSSGNGYDFSPVGTGTGAEYSWTVGHENGGLLAAPGNNSYLHTTIGTSHFGYQATVEAWIKPTAGDSDGSQIVCLLNGFALATVDGGTRIRFITYSDYTWLQAVTGTNGAMGLYDGNWHHVKGTYDGIRDINGNVNVSLYIDGVLAASGSYAKTTDTLVGFGESQTGGELYIGANAWNPGGTEQNYIGSIDGLRITNAIPEPATVSMLALGCLALLRRRKKV